MLSVWVSAFINQYTSWEKFIILCVALKWVFVFFFFFFNIFLNTFYLDASRFALRLFSIFLFYYYFGSLVTFTCLCVCVCVLFVLFCKVLFVCTFCIIAVFLFKYLSLLCGSSHFPSVSSLLLAVYQFNYEFPLPVVDYLCFSSSTCEHSFKFFFLTFSLWFAHHFSTEPNESKK